MARQLVDFTRKAAGMASPPSPSSPSSSNSFPSAAPPGSAAGDAGRGGAGARAGGPLSSSERRRQLEAAVRGSGVDRAQLAAAVRQQGGNWQRVAQMFGLQSAEKMGGKGGQGRSTEVRKRGTEQGLGVSVGLLSGGMVALHTDY